MKPSCGALADLQLCIDTVHRKTALAHPSNVNSFQKLASHCPDCMLN